MSLAVLPDPYLLKNESAPPVLVLTLGSDSLSNESNAEHWFEAVRSAILDSSVRRLLIDCEQLGPVFAAGLGKVLRIYREVYQAGGVLGLCRLPDSFREIIHITRMDKVLKLYPDMEEALDALANGK